MAFDPRQYAYKRLVDSGVHPYYAAAAVGNFDHETGGFKYPKSLVPGENSAGYAHWNAGAGRLQPFQKYMNQRGVEDFLDPQTNMDYLINEDMPRNYPKLWNRMKTQPHSLEAATKDFMETYENPAAATAGLGSRTSRAQKLYQLMQGNPAPQQLPQSPMPQRAAEPVQAAPMSQQFPNIWGELTKNSQNATMEDAKKTASTNQSPTTKVPQTGEMPKPNSKPPGYGNMGMARAGMAGLAGADQYVDMSQAAMPLLMQLLQLSKAMGGLNG